MQLTAPSCSGCVDSGVTCTTLLQDGRPQAAEQAACLVAGQGGGEVGLPKRNKANTWQEAAIRGKQRAGSCRSRRPPRSLQMARAKAVPGARREAPSKGGKGGVQPESLSSLFVAILHYGCLGGN